MLLRGCSDWQSQLPCTLLLLHLRSMATDCGRIFITLVNMVRVRGGESMSLSQIFSPCPSSLAKPIKNTARQRGLFKLKWSWNRGENETGMARLALSDADREARNWFVATTESLGCTTTVDSMV